ncbi:MAG: MarR family winged helix-turn-helix transcriptional regulator [Solirubrobacteraceae bacterium]
MAATTKVSEDAVLDAWKDLLDRKHRAYTALEKALRPHGLGVSEYEILERLATGGDDQRRMQDLGEGLHLSQSALSRAVARLEEDGLAQRGMCTEDRRGIYVCATPAGVERWKAAKPAHRGALADALG